MVYLLFGKDLGKLNYYLDKIKLKDLTAEQLNPDSDPDETFVKLNLYSPPLLSDKRLVIFENLKDFTIINFSQIHPKVDVVILQRGAFRPRLPNYPDLVIIEAKAVPEIFRFLDNLVGGTNFQNLSTIFTVLAAEDATFVFYQLISHFRRLILVKSEPDRAIEKLANWQLEKYYRITTKITLEKLKAAYKLLLTAEIRVKTGQKTLTDILPILVLQLTQNFKTL